MAKDEIKPTAYTLRFKHGKHTVLLLAEPLTPLSSIKKELFQILHEIYKDGLPSSSSSERILIPESPLDVRLGMPENVYEPSTAGWTEIDTSDLMETPKGVGLKDGSVLAFSFMEDTGGFADFDVEWSSYEEQYPDEDASMASDHATGKGKERA